MESTQTVAFDLAAGGAADGTVVVADHQTAGRGRRGHQWEDEPGACLLVSILVRSSLPLPRRPLLSFAAAVAVAEALIDIAGVEARLKWPNDVMVSGRKIAGILLESRSVIASAPTIIGIGVNVAQSRFAPDLAGRATSIALECGRAIARDALLDALLRHFDARRESLEREGFTAVRARWLVLADTIGREVRVEGQTGLAVGLDDDGALLLSDAGRTHRVVAGTATMAVAAAIDSPG